jgi:hypothetical protein|tara:strand:+ start:2606 stop:3025 length:420 start_codon:yes stop_codon:yes gene_type:complete
MTFMFDPEKVEEKNYICLPKGEYEVRIDDVVQKQSKAGNDMLELSLTAFTDEGQKVRMFDYIVNPSGLWKLKTICNNVGIAFDGTLEEQLLVGKTLKAKVELRPASEKYPERNQVSAYIETPVEKSGTVPQPVDDDIPF